MSIKLLNAIWSNPPVGGGDLLCLIALADNADDDGIAYPRMSTIARKACMSERNARRCIRRLEEAGIIRSEINHGRGGSNVYRIALDGKPDNMSAPAEDQKPDKSGLKPDKSGLKPDTGVRRTFKEPLIEPLMVVSAREPDPFDAFWMAFPRRVAKKAAEQKFRRLVAKGETTAADLIAGAERYRLETAGRDPSKIAHPTTWLNQGRWQDEAGANAHGPDRSPARQRAAADQDEWFGIASDLERQRSGVG